MKTVLSIVVKNTSENIKLLLNDGYEKRSGSCAFFRNTIVVIPCKKYFWESSENIEGINTRIIE